MNRPIKFRAWVDGEHKEYGGSVLKAKPHMEENVCVNGNGHYIWVDGFNGDRIRGAYATVPLMQFTGLTDKNGKEIYEGDVVREVLWSAQQKKDVLQEIRWSDVNGGFWVGSAYPLNQGASQDLEIVGNIYENPEMLAPQPHHSDLPNN